MRWWRPRGGPRSVPASPMARIHAPASSSQSRVVAAPGRIGHAAGQDRGELLAGQRQPEQAGQVALGGRTLLEAFVLQRVDRHHLPVGGHHRQGLVEGRERVDANAVRPLEEQQLAQAHPLVAAPDLEREHAREALERAAPLGQPRENGGRFRGAVRRSRDAVRAPGQHRQGRTAGRARAAHRRSRPRGHLPRPRLPSASRRFCQSLRATSRPWVRPRWRASMAFSRAGEAGGFVAAGDEDLAQVVVQLALGRHELDGALASGLRAPFRSPRLKSTQPRESTMAPSSGSASRARRM